MRPPPLGPDSSARSDTLPSLLVKVCVVVTFRIFFILLLHNKDIKYLFMNQSPHLPICVPQFSIGQNKRRNLSLKDQLVRKILCKLRHVEQGGLCELEAI
uniref:Uncharacterized protein n=1 Tax=Triticum urartu TaxID=4572 RepID=A0A8R7TGZ2_TRIUA